MMNFDNVPEALRQYNAWVVWRAEKTETGRITKVPYTANTFMLASSTDAGTWVSFDTAVNAYRAGGWDGIGFVLSPDDPFVFIDLDDPHALDEAGKPKHANAAEIAQIQDTIFKRFGSTYSELSPSGKGLHILAMGQLAGKGRRRTAHAVEMYDKGRFMTVTGNTFTNAPIAPAQDAIDWLYNEMGNVEQVVTFTGTYEDKEPDDVIIHKVLSAANGDKARDLATGNWQLHYPSQSEADFALINIIAHYTESRWQIVRLFRQSALGQRDKAKRDTYVLGMVDRAFDRKPPQLDIEYIANSLDAEFGEWAGAGGNPSVNNPPHAQTTGVGAVNNNAVANTLEGSIAAAEQAGNPYLRRVPGLLGDIASYIYDQAPRPVPEIALAGAIGLMSGICGRAYNVSGTGVNQYTLLLAGTGRGKEAIQSGISKLMERVQDVNHGGCPGAHEFVGPSEISSGQALVKHMDKVSRSFVSIVGEVDSTLKNMTARNANAALTKLRQVLLAVYSVSGRGNRLGATIYSDRDKNAAPIESPAFSLIGEGTPERFYNLLDDAMVSDGLLPRFNVIEYDGERVPLNANRVGMQPPEWLVKSVAQLCGQALMLNQQSRPIEVRLTAEAEAIVADYDRKIDALINSAKVDTIEQLWNRAHLKVLKLAALVAIGINPHEPTIDQNCIEWAITLIDHSTNRIVARFVSGDVGDGHSKQMADMRKALKQMLGINENRAKGLSMTPEMVRDGLISHRGLHQAISNYASFKHSREGAPRAFQMAVQLLIDGGVLSVVPPMQLQQRYGRDAGRFYVLRDANWLRE